MMEFEPQKISKKQKAKWNINIKYKKNSDYNDYKEKESISVKVWFD